MVAAIPPDRLVELFDAAAEVVEQSDLRKVLMAVVHTAMDLTGARYGAIGVFGTHGVLREFLHFGMPSEDVDRIGHLPRGEGLLGTISRGTQILRLDDLSEHPDSVGFPAGHPPMRSFMGTRLKAGDQVIGNLYLTDAEGGFDDVDEAEISALASVGGAAALNAQLHERLRRLALVEDRERIARDAHDQVIQNIFAVGLGLQSTAARVEDTDVADQLQSSIDKLDQCIASLRKFIFDLRRPSDQPDPKDEIQELLDELAAPYEVHPRLVAEGLVGQLSGHQLEALMAIVKEAVSNALRHSGSDRISVEVNDDQTHVHLVVRDRGTGFDLEQVERGMGLGNIEHRAAEAGGTFAVSSEPGVGTELRVSLPI